MVIGEAFDGYIVPLESHELRLVIEALTRPGFGDVEQQLRLAAALERLEQRPAHGWGLRWRSL